MPNTAQSIIQEIELTHSPAQTGKGIFGVQGITKRGKLAKPDVIINSWATFQKYYGGLTSLSDFPLLCKRALDRGARLRVSRVANYSNITTNTSTAVVPTMQPTIIISFVGDLVTANSTLVTINGVAGTPVVFASNSNNTMALIAAQIKTSFPTIVQDARVMRQIAPGSNQRVIVLTLKSAATVTIGGTTTCVVTSGASQTTATITALSTIQNSAAALLMTLTPRGPGVDMNNLVVSINPPSNNTIGFFDMDIYIIGDPFSVENYKNLQLLSVASTALQTGLNALVSSTLVSFTNPSLTAITTAALLTPSYSSYAWMSGTDGSAVTTNDYLGDAAGINGLYAFNPYSDIVAICAPEKIITDVTYSTGLTAYVESRKDIVGLLSTGNGAITANTIETNIQALNIDSSYMGLYGGGIQCINSLSGATVNITELGDIMGLINYTHSNFGTQFSFAGQNRGIIYSALGPVNNFGGFAQKADMNQLANARANMIINRNSVNMLWGNFTMQKAYSALSFMNVRFMINDIKRWLAPILESFLEEPNEQGTWLRLYYTVRPMFATLSDKKAFQGQEGKGWSWQGDQRVTDPSNYLVNNPTDVALGKYVVNLYIRPVVSLQEIKVSIILTPGGISFEEASQII